MKKAIFLTFHLALVSLTSWGQSESTEYDIPDNEFEINRLITELEDEIDELEDGLKECESALLIIKGSQVDFGKINFDELDDSVTRLKNHESDESDDYYYDDDPVRDDLQNHINDGIDKWTNELRSIVEPMEREVDNFSSFEIRTVLNDPLTTSIQLYRELFESYVSYWSEEVFDLNSIKNLKAVADQSYTDCISDLKKNQEDLSTEISSKKNYLTQLYENKSENTGLHSLAIMLGLPAFCVTILLLFLIPYYLERNKTDPGQSKQFLLDVATVLLLTLTILILGLAKMITGEVLGTLLGGISGYVLNRSMKNNTTPL